MAEITVVIPNYNGKKYLKTVLDSLRLQDMDDFETILVDNGSEDGSREFAAENYPEVRLLCFPENRGFSAAVNEGIRSCVSPYVILLNNDTEAEPSFVRELYEGIRRHRKAFSCQARMMQFEERDRIDGAGDCYSVLGWAFARGKGKRASSFRKEEQIFSSCAGAAIYRRKGFDRIGLFDEEHFAYLEDLDLGYRARIYGMENWYLPEAVVYHVGSGTSGSRYNQFKIRYSSRNNIYMILKNMPVLQRLLNLPFLAAGFGIKLAFFFLKGYGREYAAGIRNGFQLRKKNRHVVFQMKHLPNYIRIQLALWRNLFRRRS